jgi:hypothetical protein
MSLLDIKVCVHFSISLSLLEVNRYDLHVTGPHPPELLLSIVVVVLELIYPSRSSV